MGVPQRMDRVDLDDFRGVMKTAFFHLMEYADDGDLEDAWFACKNKVCNIQAIVFANDSAPFDCLRLRQTRTRRRMNIVQNGLSRVAVVP